MRSPINQSRRAPDRARRPRQPTERALTLSVVIPCLNEAENIELCVDRSREVLAAAGIDGEVIVVDNNSDGRQRRDRGARRREGDPRAPRAATARAYLAGFDAAQGTTS